MLWLLVEGKEPSDLPKLKREKWIAYGKG